MLYWFFWLVLVGLKSIVMLLIMLSWAMFGLWLHQKSGRGSQKTGALRASKLGTPDSGSGSKLHSYINLVLLWACFTVVPLGNYAVEVSGLHPGLTDLDLLQVTAPALGLLIFPVLGGLYMLLRLFFGRRQEDCAIMSTGRSRGVQLSGGILLALALAGVVSLSPGLGLGRVVKFQAENGWAIFIQPAGALLYLVAFYVLQPGFITSAGCKRNRFSAEQTPSKNFLIDLGRAGFIFLLALLFVHFFLGGWLVPFDFLDGMELFPHRPPLRIARDLIWLALKVGLVLYLMLKFNRRQPRLSSGQLVEGIWNFFLPVAVGNLFLTIYLRDLLFQFGSSWFFLQSGWVLFLLALFRLKKLRGLRRKTIKYVSAE